MPEIAILTQQAALADDEVYRVQQADPFAHTNGAYLRAVSVQRQAHAALNDALVQHIQNQAAEVVSRGNAMLRAAGTATADTTSTGEQS